MGSSCLNKFNGMFSFAINDERKARFRARDRAGIKPLYYFQKNNKIIFSSEIKSILNFLNIKSLLMKLLFVIISFSDIHQQKTLYLKISKNFLLAITE